MILPGKAPTQEGNILYYIEHRLLRDEFYYNTINLLNISLDDLYRYIKAIFEDNNTECKFKKEDFNIEYYLYDKTYTMIISFPITEYVTLCDRIYLLYDPEKDKKAYFTVERGMNAPEGFLCRWDSRGTHLNLNKIDSLDWNDSERVDMMNMEKYIILSIFNDL